MPLLGTDVSFFKCHSTRPASRARLSRASIKKIFWESRWPGESPWQKLYKKPLISIKNNF